LVRASLGQALRKLRLATGWRQERLGHESGVQRNFISLIETGQSQPTVMTLKPAPPAYPPAEQAASVFEILDKMRERVWAHYGPQIQQVLREQQCSTANPPASNIDDADASF
jgi:transcriptional regulator with XRE-family HTH domain